MTATFTTALPRTGDLVAVAPGAGTWKAAFRMRVTEVLTRDSNGRPLATPIIGGIVINKDGSDRKCPPRAVDYRADLVTLVTPAQPTDVDLDRAYARQAAMKRAEADPVRCADRQPHAAHPLHNAPRGVANPVIYTCVGVAAPIVVDDSDQGADVMADMIDEMQANARRTAEETAEAFLALAGRRVVVHRITAWSQVIEDDEITYRPQTDTDAGTVSDVELTGHQVTMITLETNYAGIPVRLVGSDHPAGSATPYTVTLLDESPVAPVAEAAPVTPAPEAADQVEPVMIEHPADVMAEARKLRMGDHVSGRTSNRKYFAGYLCADPSEGRDRNGNHAIVIMLASAPVEGEGSPWCLTRTARFARLPIDPAVTAQGETMSAMYSMRRAGYTVRSVPCGITTAHHAHIYRGHAAKARYACIGLGDQASAEVTPAPDQGATEALPAPVPAVAEPADTHGCPMASVNAYGRYGHRVGCPDHAEPSDVPSIEPVPAPQTESETVMSVQTVPEAAPVPAGRLVATVDRAPLIEVLAHAVKAAPSKGVAPEYAAVTIAADGRYGVTVTARGWDAVMTASLDASVAVAGSVMINTKALLKIVRATPAPKGRKALPTMVTLAHQGDQVTVTAGATALVADAAYTTLNLGPLPVVPTVAVQTARTDAFTEAVTRVTPFASTDDTLRNLMGVQVTTTEKGDAVLMAATDRYRAADVTMPATYRLDTDTDAREHAAPGLVPATFLDVVATVAGKSGADTVDMTTFATGADRWYGYRFGRYTFALRAIDGLMAPTRTLFPDRTTAHVSANTDALVAMIKRVATVDQGAPGAMRITVSADQAGNVTAITAYLLRTSARETMAATGRAANGFNFGINHEYVCVALVGAAPGDATMSFVDNRKPITVTGASDRYRALVTPVRLGDSTYDSAAPTGAPASEAAPVVASTPVETVEAAPVVAPVDVRTADQVTAAGDALVTVHGVNGHRQPITLTGHVKHVTPCLTGRVAGLVRVQLDTGRTIYVSVTATTKEDTMTATSTDTRNLPAEQLAGKAFQHATDGNYADARDAMAEASALVTADYRFGDRYTADQITAMINAHEATGGFKPAEAAPVPAQSTPAPDRATEETDAPAEASTEAAPTSDQGDADMAARVRDALTRVTWQGTTINGRSADLMVLPSIPRAVYLAVKAVVAPLGGTYARKAGNRPGGFTFAPSTVIHGTGGFTLTGREKVADWLAGDAPAEASTEAASVPAPEVAPVPVRLPTSAEVDAAFKAGYEAALATMTNAAPSPAPVPAPAGTATFTLPEFSVSGEVYGVSVAAIAERLAGDKGATVKRVARKGPDRRKFTVTGPVSAHTVADAYVKSLESRAVKA